MALIARKFFYSISSPITLLLVWLHQCYLKLFRLAHSPLYIIDKIVIYYSCSNSCSSIIHRDGKLLSTAQTATKFLIFAYFKLKAQFQLESLKIRLLSRKMPDGIHLPPSYLPVRLIRRCRKIACLWERRPLPRNATYLALQSRSPLSSRAIPDADVSFSWPNSLFILNAMQIANVRSVVRTLGYKNRSIGWMRIIITA